MRKCPYCAEEINETASWCRFCWSRVKPQEPGGLSVSQKFTVGLGGSRAHWKPPAATPPPAPEPAPWTASPISFSPVGQGMLLVGLIVTLYFYAGFSTVLTSEAQPESPHIVGPVEVHDGRLVRQRQVGLFAGIGIMALGLLAGLSKDEEQEDEEEEVQAPQPIARMGDGPVINSIFGQLPVDPRYLPEEPD